MGQRWLLLPVVEHHQGNGSRGEREGGSDPFLLRGDPAFLLVYPIWAQMPEEIVSLCSLWRNKRAGNIPYRSEHFAFSSLLPSFLPFYLTGRDDGPCVFFRLTLWDQDWKG